MKLLTGVSQVPIVARLRYASSDPFAVRITFTVQDSAPVEWVFGRDLLLQGIHMSAGIGDVRIIGSHDVVLWELRTSTGSARLISAREPLAEFLADVLDVVPAGQEDRHFDLDAELATLA